ncbi:unnamed protein product [Orchesella dallaii]|uniref:BTB domain-containing protein n=1 Tax=Orchesella dallaii TaxID=48710 RepID=A0ABP1QDI1_9HEXA
MGESQDNSSRTFKNVKLSVSECKPVTEGKAVWELRNWSDSKDFSLLKKHASCVVEDGDGASLRFFLKEEKYMEKDLIKGYSPTTEVECLSLYVCRSTASSTEARSERNSQDFGFTLRVTVDYLGEAMESSICPPGYRSVPATHLSFEGSRADSELLVLRAFILQSSRVTKHSFGEFDPVEEVYSRPNTLRYGITVRFYRCVEASFKTSNQTASLKKPADQCSPIFRDFEWMYNQKDNFSDLKLESKDGMIVSAHKFVLAARSPRLRALINEETQRKEFSGRIKIANVTAKTLLIILNWMYSGKLDDGGIEVNVIEEVIIAAANYELKELLHLLDNKLITVCNSRNMLTLFQLAQEYGLHSAVRQISTYISKNIESSVSHPQS